MPILATIQGNIGGGKSTLLEYLKSQYKGKKICFLQEPVEEWSTIKDEHGTCMLELFYSNQEKYAFGFQMMAYISRLSLLKQAYEKGYDVIISERSLETDRNIFAKMLYDDGKIIDVEYQIYLKWFDAFKREFNEEKIIYIRTTPEIVLQRIEKRARKGEYIPIEYLRKCNDYHEEWIKTIPPHQICILNGDIDTTDYPNTNDAWKKIIDIFLSL